MRIPAAVVVAAILCAALPARAQTAPAAPAVVKNWTAPTHRMLSQRLCDEILAAHPELISVTPLRDAAGENMGLLVLAYKNHGNHVKSEREFYLESQDLRDRVQKQIPSYKALFEPAR